MNASNRGPQHPRHAPSSFTSSTSSSSHYASGQGPVSISQGPSSAVEVKNASRILECSQVERQRRFQQLVRQYMSQILHGCTNTSCDTPTCFSSSRRNASRPHRSPTQLTARALAHYLACQPNPSRGLCPHELKVAPSAYELEGATGHTSGNRGDGEYVVYPSLWKLAQRYRHTHTQRNGDSVVLERQPQPVPETVMYAVKQRQQARKDPKSLGQNLYDSFTMIYSYSKQTPSPASVLSTLQTNRQLKHGDESRKDQSAEAGPCSDAHDEAADAGHRPNTNGSLVTHHVNGNGDAVRQHSRTENTSLDHSHSTSNVSSALSHGEVHTVPYRPSTSTTQAKSQRSSDSDRFSDTAATPMLSIKKTGRKNFTIGGTSLPSSEIRKPVSAASEPRGKDGNARGVPIATRLTCHTLVELKEEVYRRGKDRSIDFNYVVDYDTRHRARRTKPFVNRSLFYTLSDPETLLAAFHDDNKAFKESPLPHLDSARLVNAFRDWNHRNGALIFDSLWHALGALFIPPPELDVQKSPRLRPSRKGASTDSLPEQYTGGQKAPTSSSRYLGTHEAAHIVMICIHALTSLVPIGWPHTWAQIRKLRSWGVIVPNATPNTDAFTHPYMDIIDGLEYEPALRLADRLLRAVAARTCFEHIHQNTDMSWTQQPDLLPPKTDELVDIITKHLAVVERVALASKHKMNSSRQSGEDPGWTVTATFMEWLKSIIIKQWDSKPEINKWSSVGTAIMILGQLHSHRERLNLKSDMFEIPFFNERLDTVTEPVSFLTWEEQPNTLHVFQYPHLFSAQHLVAYFRTINFTQMIKQHDRTMHTNQMQRSLEMFLREPYWWVIKSRMKVTLSEYFVLDVSRENPLRDTLDQLWGQHERMLLKPLKVKMGHGEGEVGLDHGGVTYEFFRVVLSEAFKPDNGMFTIDPQTRMTWFQPASLEPKWKFKLLGELFSLAVYNGITLPVNFPLAFYDFIHTCGNPLCSREPSPLIKYDPVEYIKDGWPTLAEGFQHLLSWNDGDVGDVFMRQYVFSYEVYGQRIDHNLEHRFMYPGHEQPAGALEEDEAEEPAMVTNANREQYVHDYVQVLTYASVYPQIMAFSEGFMTCISSKSLQLFTPATLRDLIEGTQHITIPDLRSCVRYEDGYNATHSTIRAFWAVVEEFSQEDCRHLLEFVTASDRIPITGYESITFCIVKAGGAPESLPSSSTCFGKLYLPDYGDKDVLKAKLELAIRNSKGFGVV